MTESSSDNDKTKGRVQLPSTIVPTRYDIKITPDLQAFTFNGTVKILLTTSSDVSPDCKQIKLHAKEICFTSASFSVVGEEGSSSTEAVEISLNVKETIATFVFDKVIPKESELVLKIDYIGFLNDQMAGFYRSSYKDIHGKTKTMASTQFESIDARRCFPCWDEPARKAIFGLTLVVPQDLVCFSNMPEQSRSTVVLGEKVCNEVTFLDSPKMSTYLLAICVGEFDYVQRMTEHGVMVKVYTPPGKSSSGEYALDCAVKSLDAYDDFFGIPYPLPKLDMVGIPEFAMGAMENWGLVTYREVDVLIDPVKAANSQKQRVCTVVAHELAHQWFGNLVTMAWWDDLWLNEGFASWAENWATDQVHPDYSMWDQFTTGHLASALRLDALRSSHPIQVPIGHAEEVEEVFDAISYCKGGSVVRMARAVLGMKAFQGGLGTYMKKHAYGNTETYDLWKAWEDSSGMPVRELMASWTEQMGFPVVKVVKEDWGDKEVTLRLEQEWFLSDGSDLSEEDKKKVWSIPIMTCTKEGSQEDMTMMREKNASITVPISENGWVKLNAGQEVPMRVLPTETMIERLSDGIRTKTLPPRDRAGLLNDAYALVKAGQMSPVTLMKLLSNYSDEDSYIVWEGLSTVLGGLNTVMSDDDQLTSFLQKFTRRIVLNLLDTLGWEKKDTDGHLAALLRAEMIHMLSTFCYDDQGVATEAKRRFDAFMADPEDVKTLPSDMKTSIFEIVLKNGGEKEYDQVKSYFYTATDGAERKHVLNSLGCTLDSKLKERTMDWTTGGEVKIQDFFYPMNSVSRSSKQGRDITWTYFQNNFDKIHNMIKNASPSLMNACIVFCAGSFCSNQKADEIDAFFKDHPLPLNARKIAQTTENMRTNAKFLEIIRSSDLSKEEFWDSLA